MSSSDQDLLNVLNLYLGKDDLALGENELESALALIESKAISMHAFLDALVHSRLWASWPLESNPCIPMILAVGKEIDRLATLRSEPAYHSRKHMMDVCFMLSYLLQQENGAIFGKGGFNPWATSTQEKWLLLLAAAGHDLGHPGSINSAPYELEQQSVGLLRACLRAQEFSADLIDESLAYIEPWILGTDHAQYLALLERLAKEDLNHVDCLTLLLVEADLASSVLPQRGQLLTQRLSEEWAPLYPEKSIALRNQVGYLSFLNSLQFVSPQSTGAHIPQILTNSLSQLRTHLS